MKSVWLALLPGAVSLHLPKYTGCFNGDGGMYSRQELTDPDLREWVKFDQNKNVISRPDEYLKTKYGQQPKYLYHCTTKENAREIAKSGVIYGRKESNGDAYLGDGVYFTALPADWAESRLVRESNWGRLSPKNRNRLNAYVRVRYDGIVNLPWYPEIAPGKEDTSFCVPVPRGDISLRLPALDAEIWFHAHDRVELGIPGYDDEPELYWSAKRGLAKKPRKNTKRTRNTGPRVERGDGWIRTTSTGPGGKWMGPDWAGPPGGW